MRFQFHFSHFIPFSMGSAEDTVHSLLLLIIALSYILCPKVKVCGLFVFLLSNCVFFTRFFCCFCGCRYTVVAGFFFRQFQKPNNKYIRLYLSTFLVSSPAFREPKTDEKYETNKAKDKKKEKSEYKDIIYVLTVVC